MQIQNFEWMTAMIRRDFEALRKKSPGKFKTRLNLSWSNWGFGIEALARSAARLEKYDVRFIELHGNHYGPDLGYQPRETLKILGDHGLQVAGVCGMFSPDNDLSSNRAIQRQAAIDYIRRELAFARAVKGGYLLVVPGAVGRPTPYDANEFFRSVETLRSVAGDFVKSGIKAAVEPIRAAEVSFCHTVADAEAYLQAVGHAGIQHINGDVYHMQSGEAHIGEAILAAGERLTNLHLADSNRCALGEGALDVDTLIRALYLIGFNRAGCFVTPEPLGPGGDPYPAMYGKPDPAVLEHLVGQTVKVFREREEAVLG